LTSSLAENLRLLGFWGYYGLDRFGPWFPGIQGFFLDPLLVLSSFAVPILAFASAWRSRFRLRLLFGGLAVMSVVLMAGAYPVAPPTPFGRALLAASRSVPGASGLRTTYKVAPVLALAMALLLGAGVAEGWAWLMGQTRSRGAAPWAVAGLVAV